MEIASTSAVANHFNVKSFALSYLFDLSIEGQSIYEGEAELEKIQEERSNQVLDVVLKVIKSSQ